MLIEIDMSEEQIQSTIDHITNELNDNVNKAIDRINNLRRKKGHINITFNESNKMFICESVASGRIAELIRELNTLCDIKDVKLNTIDNGRIEIVNTPSALLDEEAVKLCEEVNRLLKVTNVDVRYTDDIFYRVEDRNKKLSKVLLIKELRQEIPGLTISSAKEIVERFILGKNIDDKIE